MKRINYIIGLFILTLGASSCLKENSNPAEGVPATMAALKVVKEAYHGKEVKLNPDLLSGAHRTTGVVISDQTTKNLPEEYVVIQHSWRNTIRGITLILNPNLAKTFKPGDSLVLNVKDAILKEENGLLTLQNIQENQIEKVSSNNEIPIQSLSLDNLSKNFKIYESTMVSTTSDMKEYPEPGETLEGSKEISDGSETSSPIELYTDPNAVFSKEKLAPSATFVGIAIRSNDKDQIRLRTINDMLFPSGSIYTGFPEKFEEPNQSVKNNYDKPEIDNNIDLLTGNWKLYYSILGETPNRDRIVSGKQAIRFQQNLKFPALLQMNFDVPDGASKITFWYGSYYNDASSTFILEYSQDQGVTWIQTGEPISDAHKVSESLNAKQATFMVNIDGPVRFRINKLGLGSTSGTKVQNGRLGVDDFAIFKNY